MTTATVDLGKANAPVAAPADKPVPGRISSFYRNNRWWILRIAGLPLQMAAFAVLIFLLMRVAPGDPVLAAAGGNPDAETYARVKTSLGLDGSLWQQFTTYATSLLQGDLGSSIVSGRTVWSELEVRFPATLGLILVGSLCTVLFALIGSYLVVLHPRNPVSMALRLYARTAGAIPDYVIGVMGILLFYATLSWLPAPLGPLDSNVPLPNPITGFVLVDAFLSGDPATMRSATVHMILPIGVLVLSSAAVLMKILVAGLDEGIDAAPTRFRVSSGAPRHSVLASLYRRALPPALTIFGSMFGALLGGAVIIEQLFNFAGMGSYSVDAISSQDFPVQQGFFLVMAFLTLVVFLIVDVVNMILDPRRRPGKKVDVA
jgi:peptide/nickel transport system permease protein